MTKQQNRYFAVTTPGFEKVCACELAALGLTDVDILRGGVEFSGGLRELYQANLWLRSATRVMVRVGEFQARDFPTLFQRLQRLPWGRFVKPGSSCDIRATCHSSRLSHSGRVAQTCREAIEKALGAEEGSAAQTTVSLRLDNDRCEVSIDSSGELLHRRGYRAAKVAAPLRENLAAACLLALGYDGSKPLVDAMTGSGTFAIEAALIALNKAPGGSRQFAFMDWPKYRDGLWQQLVQEAQRSEKKEFSSSILAVDNNPKAIDAARLNLQAADLPELITFACQPMQELIAEEQTGLIICNPPYGERLGRNASLQALYKDLGRVYGDTFSAWQGALICPDNELVSATGIPFAPLVSFSNGGIRVALLKKTGKR